MANFRGMQILEKSMYKTQETKKPARNGLHLPLGEM